MKIQDFGSVFETSMVVVEMNFVSHMSQRYGIQDFGSVFETSMLVVEMNFVSHMSQRYGIILS